MNRPDAAHPLLFDGAMGTLFAARTGRPAAQADQAVLDAPDTVAGIHLDYIHAGARAIKTSTFSLPGLYLSSPQSALEHLNAAIECARKAARQSGQKVQIWADFGPVPSSQNPASIYPALADACAGNGVDHLLFETLSGTEGLPQALEQIRKDHPDMVILCSFACASDGLSAQGFSARELLAEMDACPWTDAIGLNCLCGPAHMYSLVRELPPFTKPLAIMPNAGYPSITARAAVYDGTTGYFSRYMEKIAHAGASILGGCCGTTPDHIAALAVRLNDFSIPKRPSAPTALRSSARIKEPGILDENASAGRKSILVELDPPADDRIGSFMQSAARLQAAGADLLTIADNPIGRPRADSSLLACKVHRELGMEVLPHMTCRDRNLNAIKALLIGLSIEDVHQVLLVTGDPVPLENRDEVQAVFSFHSRTLARYVRRLEEDDIVQPFHVFAALDVNARNFDVQLRLAKEKEEAGVEGFLTQPLFSPRALENLIRARKVLKGRIYGGLMPIVSHRNALFLRNEITGMDVPEELAERYRDQDRERCEEISLAFLEDMAEKICDHTDGYYLMTPFRRVSLMERLIERIKTMEEIHEHRSA